MEKAELLNLDFSQIENQEHFDQIKKTHPEVIKEFMKDVETEAWEENIRRYAEESLQDYLYYDQTQTRLIGEISAYREEFREKILPKTPSSLINEVVELLDKGSSPRIEKIFKRFNYDYKTLVVSENDYQSKAQVLLEVILKSETYDRAVEKNKGRSVEFFGFESDPDLIDAKQFIYDFFGDNLLNKCLISGVYYTVDQVNIQLGEDSYMLPIEVYKQLENRIPYIKAKKYRAEAFTRWNTDFNFSKKYIPLPIYLYSHYGEETSKLSYLQGVAEDQKMRLYKLGSICHEVAHHIYDYLMDSDTRKRWKELVDAASCNITQYCDQYEESTLKYDEAFSESVRLKSTAPIYLKEKFPEIDEFLESFLKK